MLKIKDLRKHYGNFTALDGLNLAIKPGEIFGFVGPNGAGKTTTMKIIAGLLRADGGEVLLGDTDILKRPEIVKDVVGYMPDFFGTYDSLKVREYMEFYCAAYGLYGYKARKKYEGLLENVGLADKRDAYVDGLSRGMKQRLCLARALVHNPDLIVLDEPASGLDPRTRYDLKEILRSLREEGKTILISSHILSELSEICTDIGIIEQGRMVLRGTIEEINNQVNISNPLIIRVYSDLDKAVRLLRSNPLIQTMTVEGKEIRAGFHGDEREEAILLQQLNDTGILVSGFMREQGSLETIFMEITGKEEKRTVSAHEFESDI